MTATVGIDPRIKARRIAVRRDAGHRRLRRLQAVGAVLVAFGVAYAITRSPVLDVDRVRLDGLAVDGADVDASAVRGALGVATGVPMTDVDTQAVADRVADLPGVESVRVRRSWPATLEIAVTPSRPGLAVATTDGWLVVDRVGRIIGSAEDPPPGLVPMGGVVAEGAVGEMLPDEYRAVAGLGSQLPADLRERISEMVIATEDTIDARLRDGGTIVFGVDGDQGVAARSAAAVLATIPSGCVDQIDVLSASAPVLLRSTAC